MDNILEKIKNFADIAHGDQKRKYTPERYIVHPVRVMQICREHTNELPLLAAALLHDVLEDTPTTQNEIKEHLITLMDINQANYSLKLIIELTDVYTKDNYPKWNRRKRKTAEAIRIEKTSADSQTVKYADIIDNCIEIINYDADFANVFLRECKAILKKIPKGNKQLYERAVKTVDDCINKLNQMVTTKNKGKKS
jgi:guanosine-3',5'-bis(diphosphate) 3'-pyrophosphohydrolase